MSLKNITKEELEILSYTDITYLYLKENGESANTAVLFKKICKLLNLSDDEFTEKVGDYYTSLVLEKRFKLLSNNEWDLSEKHIAENDEDDDNDEDDLDDISDLTEEDESEEDDYEDDDMEDASLENDFDDTSDFSEQEDLKGLNIISEDELED